MSTDTTSEKPRSARRLWFTILGAVVLLGALAYGVYWHLDARHYESTDDAYVGGNIVQITPQVAGTIVSITADDTEFVRAGQVLVELDKADAEVAMQQAEAKLAKAVRDVRNLFATSAQEQATVAQRESDLAKVREDLRAWLRRLHDEVHVTTVLVTHDQSEALDVADRIAVLNKGRIEQVGSPTDVYDSPTNGFVMSFLGAVSTLNGALVRPHDIRVGRNPEMAVAGGDASAEAIGVVRAKVDRVVAVVDCYHAANPNTIAQQIEGGIVYGLTAALYGEITIKNGAPVELNFNTYPLLKMADTPKIETYLNLSGGEKWGGIGEPSVAPIAPALCNAIYAATGKRVRKLPLKHVDLKRA